jgi:hypothetical protein
MAKKTKRKSTRVIRDFCNGTKTRSEFFSGFRSYLRRLWMWGDPLRKEVLAKVKVGSKYYCYKCEKLHIKKNIEVNHIEQVGSLKDFCDIQVFYERLFVSDINLIEAICKECHAKITKEQNGNRD